MPAKKQTKIKEIKEKKTPTVKKSAYQAKKLAKPPQPTLTDLNQLYASVKQSLFDQSQWIQSYTEMIDRLQQQCESLHGACFHRQRLELSETIRCLEAHRDALRENRYLVEFEQKSEPFLKSFQQVTFHKRLTYREQLEQKTTGGAAGKTKKSLAAGHETTKRFTPAKIARIEKDRAEYIEEGEAPSDRAIVLNWKAAVNNDAPSIVLVLTERCQNCSTVLRVCNDLAEMQCPRCHQTQPRLNPTLAGTAYSEEVEIVQTNYQKGQHAHDTIQQIQCKDAEVPQHILTEVMWSLAIDFRVTDARCVTKAQVLAVLKLRNLPKYYERVTQIYCRICGLQPPRMSPDLEHWYMVMFSLVQKYWEKHRPADRRNFSSYQLVLWYFCILTGNWQFLECFSLLKGEPNLKQQEETLAKIFRDPDLDWEFIPVKEIQARVKKAIDQYSSQQNKTLVK
jgi:hypothetical protein